MRILHCSDSFWPRTNGIGGVQVWLSQLCQQQVREGHTVGVVTWAYPGCSEREVWKGIDVFRWPATGHEIMSVPEKLKEFLRAWEKIKSTFEPQVVHAHLNLLAAWACTLGTRMAPMVVTVHVPAGHDGIPERMRQRVMDDANLVVVPSEDLSNSLIDRDPALEKKLRVIEHGMDEPGESIAPLPSNPVTFLCLGRLVPEKGFEMALRALARTGRRDFRMIVAGEGRSEAELRKYAAELGIDSQVHFPGWVRPDAVPALINQATVILVPSLWREPFGLVALQAAQMGRPVIASRIGGIPEIVEDGVTGRLVPPGDSEALAQTMLEAAANPAQLSLWGGQDRQRTREIFTIAACSARYHAAYCEQL